MPADPTSYWPRALGIAIAVLMPPGSSARAESFYSAFVPVALQQADFAPPPVVLQPDAILVVKSEHRLYLMSNGIPFRSYPIRLGLTPVGPKRQEFDFRTPEGHYIIDSRSRSCRYFRALHVSYPNAEDRRQAAQRHVAPGGDIMIHGMPNAPRRPLSYYETEDWTNGCIALSNEDLLEVWSLVPVRVPIEIRP